MKRYRTEIHGHVLEAREGDWGGREVLIDGRQVTGTRLSAFLGRPLRFDLRDDSGQVRAVEVRWAERPRSLGLRSQVRVSVDGLERAVLDAIPDGQLPGVCPHCGYDLKGLPADNGEVRCPECGRHTAASLLRTK